MNGLAGETIRERLSRVRDKVERALSKGKGSQIVPAIMACTKTHPKDTVRRVIAEGIFLIGENRVQEARDKYNEGAYAGARLCLIGHLQSNKASLAVRIFDEIHSVDSLKLAALLSKYSGVYRKEPLPCMIEVNIGKDPRKSGCLPEETLSLAQKILEMEGLRLKGLMTVAPGYGDPIQARNAFSGLRKLRNSLIENGIPPENMQELSMGMSSDYEIACEEGATIIRLGTELLGPRPTEKDI